MKTKKSVLGFIGLFIVAITTTIAYHIPMPTAEAASGSEINIQATVLPVSQDIKITKPANGSTVVSASGELTVSYVNITSGEVKIVNSETGAVVFSASVPVDSSGAASFNYTLPGYGKYQATFYAATVSGTRVMSSSSSFSYNSISSQPNCDSEGNCTTCDEYGNCTTCDVDSNCVVCDINGVCEACDDDSECSNPQFPPEGCVNTATCNPDCPSGNCNSGGGDCAGENCSNLPKEDPDNPVITVCYDENVSYLSVIVRNLAGEIVRVETVEITDEDRAKGNCKDIEIRLDEEVPPLPEGVYVAEVTAKDKDGTTLGDPIYIRFYYKRGVSVEVPKTGVVSFGSISLTPGDLAVTALGLTALISLWLAFMKKRKAAKS
jgi:hypothetical protein